MTGRSSFRALSCLVLGLVLCAGSTVAPPQAASRRSDLPARFSDAEFWSLSTSLSEPGGTFRSDNLVSNERLMQSVIPTLLERVGTAGVYLGVGPEQNFTYIAALEPRIAFIVDVRRGNRDLHLMYKALFELAADRAEFVSMLFGRPKPAGLAADASADVLFDAYDTVAADEVYGQALVERVRAVLVERHRLPLSTEELAGIEQVMRHFHRFGPGLAYTSSTVGRAGPGTTYGMLMRATDDNGVNRSYLASERAFRVVKRMQAANLIVPVVGNFAGPTALRAVGDWVRAHGETVSVFYLSNVEDYLQGGLWTTFCQNVTTLPRSAQSTFIRSGRGLTGIAGSGGTGPLGPGRYTARGTMTTTTTTLPDGRTVTLGVAMGSNRLGVIADDVKGCASGQDR